MDVTYYPMTDDPVLEPTNEEDAVALLQTRCPVGKSFRDEARALVQALECIPLALIQAAAYIRMREMMFSTYLDLFHESEANQAHILKNEAARDRRDPSIWHVVITTWQISFEQVRKTNPAATDLLSLMSMFDRQGIPEALLHQSTNRAQFEEAVAPLISYSLVKTETGQQTENRYFEMHPLVQFSTRKWLELNQLLGKWRKESLRSLAVVFPNGQYEMWATCQVLLPHSKMVLSYLDDEEGDEDEVLYRAEIANNTAWYLSLRGDYVAAEKLGRVGLEGREKILGREHLNTLGSVTNLGYVLMNQGKYEEAEKMHRRCLAGKEKVLGQDHPDTLVSVTNLGFVLMNQGKYEEAETMHRRCLKGKEKVLEREHPDTLISVNNLGSTLKEQGKYEEAETMHRRCLEGREKVLGREHPDTLISVNNLGSVLERQGKYEEAEAMYLRALKESGKVLGLEHPSTLSSVKSLGMVLEEQGRFEEAEAMLRRALKGREKVLGSEHPETLHSVCCLAELLHKRKRYNDAADLYHRASSGFGKALGPSHPTVLACDEHWDSMVREMKHEERS